MKNALFITYREFFPVTSGEKIRMMQNLKMLAFTFDVDCAIACDEKISPSDINEIKKIANNVYVFDKQPKFIRLFRSLMNLLVGKPFQNGYFYNSGLSKFLKKNSSKYDLLFCNHIRTAMYFLKKKTNFKVLDLPDCVTLNMENEAKTSKSIRKLVYSRESKSVKNFEIKNYQKFDSIMVISKNDRDFLIKMNPNIADKLLVVYNHVRDLGYNEATKELPSPAICFMGRIAYAPNSTALVHFIENILPTLKKQYPNLTFNIYGGSHCPKVEKFNGVGGVKIHGFVEDVAKEIQQNTFVVAPMMSGSGTQNKILECMYLRKTVITTPVGLDGLQSIGGNEIVVANNDKEMIDKCLFYLSPSNRSKREEIGLEAYNYIMKTYSFEIVRKQFNKAFASYNDKK